MPRISIIIPVYNSELYLHNCLDSVLSQVFTDFELILINDGSTDSSGEICDEYAENDSRIRVFHQDNQGQAAARNFGVNQARTEWIYFVDSDDIIHPQMLETLYNNATSNNTPISICAVCEDYELPADFCKPVKVPASVITINESSLMNLFENVPYMYWIVCDKLVKKDIVLNNPFTVGKFYEDNAVVCRWLYEAKKICVTNGTMYFYRINTSSTTKREFNIKQCDYLWALQKQIEFFKTTECEILLSKICHRYLFEYSVFYKKILSVLLNKKLASKLKRQVLLFMISNINVFIKTKSDFLFAVETLFPGLYSLLVKIKT